MKRMQAITSVLLCLSAVVSAMSGDEVLDRMREATTASDRRIEAVMRITDKNGRVQERVLRMVMKGDNKLLVRFLEPADLRGVSFMSTSPENMWVYLPAQGRVRRISGSAAEASFGGSDFSYKEMANISFGSSRVQGVPVETELNGVRAYQLLIDDGGTQSRLWVEKERYLPLQVEQLDRDGGVRKRIIFAEFQQEKGVWMPWLIRLENRAKGSVTELRLRSAELNIGIRDSYFSEENMKKGG
ncbi:MAG: outer membrane lipoprotein-sorting protein [candidate division WOR-3 bacterium]|uniref:Outer membrane lipoprotein-sorting protein n=1 Tax=candidate division WOR-3 bacterium TaxID=2052148 RepID=A0A7C3IYH5_UNCW3|nr:outer membrane lipoprotein-sorting protein [candidate division WOR-3 bacterium]